MNTQTTNTAKEALLQLLADAFRPTVSEPSPPKATPYKAVLKKLEKANEVLSSQNPDLKGKTKTWGLNPKSRMQALAAADKLVREALDALKGLQPAKH